MDTMTHCHLNCVGGHPVKTITRGVWGHGDEQYNKFAYNYHKSPQLLYHGGFTVITTTDTMVFF